MERICSSLAFAQSKLSVVLNLLSEIVNYDQAEHSQEIVVEIITSLTDCARQAHCYKRKWCESIERWKQSQDIIEKLKDLTHQQKNAIENLTKKPTSYSIGLDTNDLIYLNVCQRCTQLEEKNNQTSLLIKEKMEEIESTTAKLQVAYNIFSSNYIDLLIPQSVLRANESLVKDLKIKEKKMAHDDIRRDKLQRALRTAYKIIETQQVILDKAGKRIQFPERSHRLTTLTTPEDLEDRSQLKSTLFVNSLSDMHKENNDFPRTTNTESDVNLSEVSCILEKHIPYSGQRRLSPGKPPLFSPVKSQGVKGVNNRKHEIYNPLDQIFDDDSHSNQNKSIILESSHRSDQIQQSPTPIVVVSTVQPDCMVKRVGGKLGVSELRHCADDSSHIPHAIEPLPLVLSYSRYDAMNVSECDEDNRGLAWKASSGDPSARSPKLLESHTSDESIDTPSNPPSPPLPPERHSLPSFVNGLQDNNSSPTDVVTGARYRYHHHNNNHEEEDVMSSARASYRSSVFHSQDDDSSVDLVDLEDKPWLLYPDVPVPPLWSSFCDGSAGELSESFAVIQEYYMK